MKIVDSFQHEEVVGFKFGYVPFGKPKMFAHLYFIDGLLIDAGQSRMKDSVLSELKDYQIDKIFLSHHHEDHTGNVESIRSMANCKVYGSKLCSDMMKDPPGISPAQKMVWGDRDSVDYIEPVADYIDTPNYRFELIPIPGHAPDMVALYERSKRWLFSSDLYVSSYIGYMLPDENLMEQIESIDRV